MVMTDPIADFLTRIRNANQAKKLRWKNKIMVKFMSLHLV